MLSYVLKLCFFLSVLFVLKVRSQGCNQRYFEYDSFVCVCNETSCDWLPRVPPPDIGYVNVITSSRDEFRFDVQTLPTEYNSSLEVNSRAFINISDIRQTMIGFGGAFTDSAGISVLSLSQALQDIIIRQYFSPDGLEYNIGRIPIAGCDFSTHPYSYDDVEGDVDLIYFNLTIEDYLYKIPLIKRAQELSERPIKLFASPWSPPSWMKTNGMFNGTGSLIPEMSQPWANYFIKFLDAYKQEGLTLWGLTSQNEPIAGSTDYAWNSCHFTAEQQRDFIRYYLGPALNNSGYSYLDLMIVDDGRELFPQFPLTVLADSEVSALVAGIAVHWYSDNYFPASLLNKVHDQHPDKYIIYTEACTGYLHEVGKPVELGNWERGEQYTADMIENINHWSTGWTDWNLALDMIGGPNWASNYVDSPIIVNKDANEFYKEPMFYAMGHFSKFIEEGMRFVASTVTDIVQKDIIGGDKVQTVSFIDSANRVIAVILNKNTESKTILIEDSNGNSFTISSPAKSFQTIIYNS